MVRPGAGPVLGQRRRAVRVQSQPGRQPVPSRAVHRDAGQPAGWPERHRHRPSGPGRRVRRHRRRRLGPDQPVRARSPATGQPGRPSVAAVVLLPPARCGHRGTQRRFAGRRRRRVHRGGAACCRSCGRTESSRQPRRARCDACCCIPARPAPVPARPAGALRARHGKRSRPARRRVRNHAVAGGRPSPWRDQLALPGGARIPPPAPAGHDDIPALADMLGLREHAAEPPPG